MKLRDLILKAGAAAILLIAVNTAVAKGKPSDLTIVETAIALSGNPFMFDSNPDDFDILVAAVVATGVGDDILNGEDDYTVFAPNDQAFIDACEVIFDEMKTEVECFSSLAGALTVPGVKAVLAYHVTEGVRNSNAVTHARKIKMLDGNTISGRGGFVDGIGSDADFVSPELLDIRVADGMIHVIDFVLLPFEL